MKYYIVVNEWNYPDDTGWEIIGSFEHLDVAIKETEYQYKAEYDNFLEATDGKIYKDACGSCADYLGKIVGYSLHSSKDELYDHFFRSIIIEREI